MKLFSATLLGLTLDLFFSSCIRNYTFQKLVINNSKYTVEVEYGCCGNIEKTIIPAFTEKIVFQCAYQSINPPSCDEIDGKCKLTSEGNLITKDIGNGNNWLTEVNGKTVQCVFTIDPINK